MSDLVLIIVLSFIAFILSSIVIFYFIQEYILFHPSVLAADHKFNFPEGCLFEEFHFNSEHNAIIHGLRFKVEQPKALLFYFHGNSKDVQFWGKWCEHMALKYQMDVVLWDYRGFGKSSGTRSYSAMLNDALNVYRYFEHEKLKHIIYGRSLGGAFASHVAQFNNLPHLILESTFTRASDIVLPFSMSVSRYFILRFPFQNLDTLKKYKGKLYIIHGKADTLIKVKHAERLFHEACSEHKAIHIIEKGAHRGLNKMPEYYPILDQIFAEIMN